MQFEWTEFNGGAQAGIGKIECYVRSDASWDFVEHGKPTISGKALNVKQAQAKCQELFDAQIRIESDAVFKMLIHCSKDSNGNSYTVHQYGPSSFHWTVESDGLKHFGECETRDKAIGVLEDYRLQYQSQNGVRVHETGAQRSTDADDCRFDLIPQLGLKRVAQTMQHGMKYGANNWRKGFKWSDTMNHCLKHLNEYQTGDRSDDHLAHAVANLMFLMEFETIHPELNDLLTADDFRAPPAIINTTNYGD